MKSLLVVVFAACSIHTIKATSNAEWDAKVAAVGAECRTKFTIDDKAFEGIINERIVPDTKDGKCAMACIMKGLGYIKDGTINVEMLNAGNRVRFEKPEVLETAKKINELCVKEGEAETNECDSAAVITACLIREYTKVGLHV